MSKPRILVTGATGKTGAAVVEQLCAQGYPVRAMVRSRDARSRSLEALGAEIVVADFFDPEQLSAAMRGVARAYYCPPWHSYMTQSVAAFAVAAKEARLESIVALSQWLASPSHPSLETRQLWLMEKTLAMIPGTTLTIVNPGLFADSYLLFTKFAAQLGTFPMPVDGEGRNAPPSNEDIARVVVAALIDPVKHAGKTYRPTGPKLLSVNEMTEILSRVLQRKVRHVRMPLWMFYKAARMLDTSVHSRASGYRHYVGDHDSGGFEFAAPTSHVFDVTGEQPEDFETVARRYAALPESKRTFGNEFRAFLNFMSVPFRPGFAPEQFDREQFHPAPAKPRLVMQDERWKAERAEIASTKVSVLKRAAL